MVHLGETGPTCLVCGQEKGHGGPCYVGGMAQFTSREETAYVDPNDLLSRPITGAKVTAINEDLFKQVLLAHIPQGTGLSKEGLFNGCSCRWETNTRPNDRYASWIDHIIAMARVTPLVLP